MDLVFKTYKSKSNLFTHLYNIWTLYRSLFSFDQSTIYKNTIFSILGLPIFKLNCNRAFGVYFETKLLNKGKVDYRNKWRFYLFFVHIYSKLNIEYSFFTKHMSVSILKLWNIPCTYGKMMKNT